MNRNTSLSLYWHKAHLDGEAVVRRYSVKFWFSTCATALMLLWVLAIPSHLAAQSNALQGFSYKVLYTFTGGTDGGFSSGDLIQDAQGNLYGTANNGGDPECNCGVVFKVDLHGNETVLYTFTGGTDGGGSKRVLPATRAATFTVPREAREARFTVRHLS